MSARAPMGFTARLFDPDTSHAAAPDGPAVSKLQAEILDQFAVQGPMTDEQLCARMSWKVAGTCIKRRTELAHAGLVVDSGRRAPTRTGRMAIVWAVAP